ncbi:hypothetical protein ACWD0Z_13345 [Streptomyces sp. NPDC003007]
MASPLGWVRRAGPRTGRGPGLLFLAAVLLAGLGGTAVGARYALLGNEPVPWAITLVPVAVYAACLLAAATALPLLRRSVRPGELRYA